MLHGMRLTIAYSKIKKRNLVLINNDTHQRETVSERPIRPPLSPGKCVIDLSESKLYWYILKPGLNERT